MTRSKTITLFCSLFLLAFHAQTSYAQKTELNISAYSGFFSFHGNGATANSWLNFDPYRSPNTFTSNVYGTKSGFPFTFELQGQCITKSKTIFGLGASYESLESKVNIDTITENGFLYWQYTASGKTSLRNTFITLNPYIGHRSTFHGIRLDLLAGLDLAICLKSEEHGEATTSTDYHLESNNNKPMPAIDLRPRLQIKTQYKHLGFLAGYSLGLTNYQSKNSSKIFSGFLRLGFSYQIR